MSRASLIEVYIAALPFSVLAVVAVPGGRCRIETAAPGAPPSATIAKYYFKPSHLDLVLSAAGLAEGEVNRSADVVAALLERTAMTMRAPFETADELRKAAEQEVDKIVERVKATNQAGGLSALNRAYKRHRQQQIARAERAQSYSSFIEDHYTVGIVRSVASVGRMV